MSEYKDLDDADKFGIEPSKIHGPQFLCWWFGHKITELFEAQHEYADEGFPPVQLGYCCRCGEGPFKV